MNRTAHVGLVRLARSAAALIGVALVFVCALPCAVLVHASAPALTRVVVATANRIMARAFRGQVEVLSLRRFGLHGVDGMALAVRDPQGREVATANGVTVHIRLPALAWAELRGRRDVPIVIDDVLFRRIDATLVSDPGGKPTLALAFAPRHPTKTTSAVRVTLRSLRGDSLRVRGHLGPFDELTASGSAVEASFAHDDRGTTATLRRLDLTTVGVATQPIRTAIRGDVFFPASGQRRASASVAGWIGDVPIDFAGSLQGDHVEASLDVRATDDSLRQLAPALALGTPASAHVELHGLLSKAHASARIVAAGGTLDANADVRRENTASTIAFEARAAVPDLARVPRLRDGGVHGSGTLTSRGRLTLPEASVDAELELGIRGARVRDLAAPRAVAHARVRGALASPLAHVSLLAEGVRVAGRTFDTVAVDANGPLREPAVAVVLKGPRVPEVRAHASLDLAHGFDVRGARAVLTRDGARVVARVDRIHVGGGAVDVRGIDIESGGEPLRGEVHVRPQLLWTRLSTSGMDLNPVLRVSGATPVTMGRVAVDIDLRADRAGAAGHLNAGFETAGVKPTSARVALRFGGRRVDGHAEVASGDLNAHATIARIVLDGPPTAASSWQGATGAARLDCNGTLESIRSLLPESAAPWPRMAGRVALQLRITKKRPDGPTDLALDGTLADRTGTLLLVDADARPNLLAMRGSHGSARSALEGAPIHVHLEVPDHDVSTLPRELRPDSLQGHVEASADLNGEATHPQVQVHVRAHGLRTARAPTVRPVDGVAEATYDGRTATARTVLSGPDGVVLDARYTANVLLADVFNRPVGEVRWDAGATATLHEFPLQGVLPRSLRDIGGLANGVFVLEGLHRDARMDVDVRLSRPSLGIACFEDGWLRLRLDGQLLVGTAGLQRPGSSLKTSIRALAHWGASLEPSFDGAAPIDVTLEAQNFRAAALMPLLRGPINRLDGRIDANATLQVDPSFQTGTMEGDVRFTAGVLEVPALDERLHDVSATVSVRPWGTLRFDDVTARGSSGRLKGSAKALLDGLRLRSATADVEIGARDRMPLTVEGVSLGEASGSLRADATMSPDQKRLEVHVTLAALDMRLSPETGRSVQSLEPARNVVIGRAEPDGRFVELPMHAPRIPRPPGSTEVRVEVDLGDDVRVRRDATLDLQLTGTASIDVTDAPHVSGAIRLVRGTVDVFGKRFTVDPSSTVSFTGDPNNPQVVATAQYDAPDGTHVFADVVGPVKKPNILLRSEPARSQDAILGLLVFGSEEGLSGTPAPDQQPDPMQRAAGVASGPVTEALNKALSGITSLEVSTRVDTSQAANPRPEVALRVTNDVLARVTVQTGMPAPGELPDRTLLTVDWRFSPRWSLESTVGDEGSTSVDLLWHHRY